MENIDNLSDNKEKILHTKLFNGSIKQREHANMYLKYLNINKPEINNLKKKDDDTILIEKYETNLKI